MEDIIAWHDILVQNATVARQCAIDIARRLAKRCRDKGFKIVYEPKLHVMHVDASSTNSAYNNESVLIKRKMLNITESCRVYLKMFDSKR